MKGNKHDFYALKDIVARLRAPNGCPWDREQTHESLKRYLIEETYETIEAIDAKDPLKICDELGDVLLQVFMHAQIASESGAFDMEDVIDNVATKMIVRHRHVFGDKLASNSAEALSLWDDIKREEKGHTTHAQGLKDVPAHLPALMRGYKIQQKAAKAGFDWDNVDGAWEKVREEMGELEAAVASGSKEDTSDELGDLLFAVVNVSRFVGVHPELALTGTIEKFIRRFSQVESMASKEMRRLEDMTLAEMDILWNEVKQNEKEIKEREAR